MESNGGKGVNQTNEESEAVELNKGETCSKKDYPGLERTASQDFEHQWEVMYHLKSKLYYSPCECIASSDMSYFQPFHIYFKPVCQSIKHF